MRGAAPPGVGGAAPPGEGVAGGGGRRAAGVGRRDLGGAAGVRVRGPRCRNLVTGRLYADNVTKEPHQKGENGCFQ